MLEKFKNLPELASLTILIVVSLLFFTLTNPKSLPPAALVIGFGLVFGVVYSGVVLLAKLYGLQERVSKGQWSAIRICGTAFPVILLALQSLGQLTIRDVITLGILFGAVYLYVSRMSAP